MDGPIEVLGAFPRSRDPRLRLRHLLSARASAKLSARANYTDALSPRMQEAVDFFSGPAPASSGPAHSTALESVLEIPDANLGKLILG